MLRTGAAAMMFIAAFFFSQPIAWAQASTEAPLPKSTPEAPPLDPGPHPELDPDMDYAFWCHATINTLVMMDVLQEKHFKRNPQEVIQSLNMRIGNTIYNLEKEAVEQMLQEYNAYYLGDTVAFSTSKNPRDLRKDIRGCRNYF